MSGVHVLPRGDQVAHEATADCLCGPRAELVRVVGGDAWLYVHHSLDGREQAETSRRTAG